MMALLIPNGGKAIEYTRLQEGGKKKAMNEPLPVIVVSTTAGTGSEVDCAGAFTNVETEEKVSFSDTRLFPKIAIIDPSMMVTIPKTLTAYQGWDALTHSMENLINKNQHELAQILARQVIQTAGMYLPKVCLDGKNEKARENMAMCSFLSGIVICSSGTTSMHALECAMSAKHPQLAHGAGLILLSKAYYQFFIDKHVCDDIFIDMAKLLGNVDASDPYDFITEIQRIHEKCGVSSLKMSEYGIQKEEFKDIIASARKAMGSNFDNDRYPLSDMDCMEILEKSYC